MVFFCLLKLHIKSLSTLTLRTHNICSYLSVYSRYHLHRALHDAAFRELWCLRCKFHTQWYHDQNALLYLTVWVMLLPVFSNKRKSDCVQNSTVTARAKNFHSVQYLLVHGTADGELRRAVIYLCIYLVFFYIYTLYSNANPALSNCNYLIHPETSQQWFPKWENKMMSVLEPFYSGYPIEFYQN